MSKETIYIAYGSNLNLPQMSMRCPDAEVLGTSEIRDYELVFRGSKTGSYATIEPCEGATVPVLLWRISGEDEKMLDLYEGYPKFYGKETMTLPLNDSEVTAMVYIMPDHHRLGMPSQHYVDTLLEGYETADFDPDILYNALDKTEERMAQEPQQSKQPLLFQQGWW